MNAIQLLRKDHRAVEALFKSYERQSDGAVKQKRDLAQQIIRELSVHAAVEEQLLYPAARARNERLKDLVLESLEEHHVAKATLAELDKMSPEDERFDAKMTVLMENIRHHVKEEQEDLFPKLQKAMKPAELNELGRLLELAKKAAPTHPHPMAPDTPPGNVIVGALAKLLDSGKDLVREMTGGAAKSRASRRPGRQPAKKRR